MGLHGGRSWPGQVCGPGEMGGLVLDMEAAERTLLENGDCWP